MQTFFHYRSTYNVNIKDLKFHFFFHSICETANEEKCFIIFQNIFSVSFGGLNYFFFFFFCTSLNSDLIKKIENISFK